MIATYILTARDVYSYRKKERLRMSIYSLIEKKSETRMTASVLNQDPNKSKVQKNAIY